MSSSTENAGASTLQLGQRIKPNVSLNQAKQLVEEHYALNVECIKELNSYDDNNFYVKGTTTDGKQRKCTFKVLNSMDSKKTGHIETEHAAMRLLSENGINCPIPLKNVKGDNFALVVIQNDVKDVDNNESNITESEHIIRLLSFVEGKIMNDVAPSLKLFEKVGKYIAQVNSILKTFSSSALDNHSSIWMLSHVLELEKFMYIIKEDGNHFDLVSDILTAYRNQVLPIYQQLEKGVIHGDFNEQNILVAPSSSDADEYDVHGLIDFGDLQINPYIYELAITICYMMLECVKEGVNIDPFMGAQSVLKGYTSVRTLSDDDIKVLRILISCRLCQSLVMGAYTYSLDPGNEYLLTTAKTGWKLLEKVWKEKTDDEVIACWTEAIRQ